MKAKVFGSYSKALAGMLNDTSVSSKVKKLKKLEESALEIDSLSWSVTDLSQKISRSMAANSDANVFFAATIGESYDQNLVDDVNRWVIAHTRLGYLALRFATELGLPLQEDFLRRLRE